MIAAWHHTAISRAGAAIAAPSAVSTFLLNKSLLGLQNRPSPTFTIQICFIQPLCFKCHVRRVNIQGCIHYYIHTPYTLPVRPNHHSDDLQTNAIEDNASHLRTQLPFLNHPTTYSPSTRTTPIYLPYARSSRNVLTIGYLQCSAIFTVDLTKLKKNFIIFCTDTSYTG